VTHQAAPQLTVIIMTVAVLSVIALGVYFLHEIRTIDRCVNARNMAAVRRVSPDCK
jgi:hypothetical protein